MLPRKADHKHIELEVGIRKLLYKLCKICGKQLSLAPDECGTVLDVLEATRGLAPFINQKRNVAKAVINNGIDVRLVPFDIIGHADRQSSFIQTAGRSAVIMHRNKIKLEIVFLYIVEKSSQKSATPRQRRTSD